MGSKNKLRKFQENSTFKNVIQPSIKEIIRKNHILKGKWRKNVFKNSNKNDLFPVFLIKGFS